MLLADSAQVADGKLYILGGGWSVTGPDPTPSAVAMKVMVDWHEFNASHHWELFLEDADGQPVRFETPDGPQPIEVRGDFSAAAPDGVPVGTPVDVPIAVNFGPIPLAGRRSLHLAHGHRRRLVARGDGVLHDPPGAAGQRRRISRTRPRARE